MIQFLIESGVVSGVGGIMGIGLGIMANFLIGKFSPLKPVLNIKVMLIAFTFSLAVGIIFGIYPANKAAKLKPIDALRYE